MNISFTEKQTAFIAACAAGMTGAQAARHAGYSVRTAKVAGSRLAARADIKAAIAKARGDQLQEPERNREYESAQAYLEAVVAGTERPDVTRVAAARVLISFQAPRLRRPLPSAASPAQEARSEAMADERAQREQWAAKVVVIRSKLGRKADDGEA